LASYYDILGVEKDASCDSIKRAFRCKAKLLHPDINGTSAAKLRFQQINEAYQVLSDSEKRRTYDLHLHYGLPARRVYYRPGNVSTHNPHSYRYTHRRRPEEDCEEEEQTPFEKAFDQFLYLFVLGVGLFATFYGVSRLWADPIEGVNPAYGVLFGALFTGLLIWGWTTRNKKKC
jgi:curved DNA-binding protein CbpA